MTKGEMCLICRKEGQKRRGDILWKRMWKSVLEFIGERNLSFVKSFIPFCLTRKKYIFIILPNSQLFIDKF